MGCGMTLVTVTGTAYVVEWRADDVLDATHAVTYSIVSQSVAGAFAINSDSGVITVANGALRELRVDHQSDHHSSRDRWQWCLG